MPKFGEDMTLDQHKVGHFGFTAVSLDDLESSGYTLATIVCDRSGSTQGFQKPMEDALKASVEALRRHPCSEQIMLRVLTIDSVCTEQHGFIPLADIDVSRYDNMLAPQGMTSLFDGAINAAEAASAYGKQLMKDRFNANGIQICVTDGANNSGKFPNDADVIFVKKAFEDATLKENLESFCTILIAVNMQHAEYADKLRQFHLQAGFSTPLIELADANPDTIAKIGQFIAASVSSTSTALGTGSASMAIKF